MKRIIAVALVLMTAPKGPAWAQSITSAPSFISAAIEQQASPSSTTATPLYETKAEGATATSDALSWSGACTSCSGWGVSAGGAGYVTNGALGSSATVTITGSPPAAPAEVYGETASAYNDSLTISGGTGTGVLALTYSLDGTLSSSAPSSNLVIFGLYSSTAPAGTEVSLNGATNIDRSYDELLGVTGSQSDRFSVYVPFTYGTAFTITPWLWTIAQYPGGTATPYTSAVDFYNTMLLNSALVYGGTPGALGAENAAAMIGTSSGLVYGPDGVSAVPLPATVWLLLSALAGLGIAERRRLTV